MVSDTEIMDRGIHCLLEKLGVVETERFIAVINRERFDYTRWQRERFDSMSSDEFIPTNANNCRLHSITSERISNPALRTAIKCVHEYNKAAVAYSKENPFCKKG